MTANRALDWTGLDIGRAMLTHYTGTTRAWKRKPDGVEGPATWRPDGDNTASFRIWEARGAWADARRGLSGGGREYAALYGMTLPELMEIHRTDVHLDLVVHTQRKRRRAQAPDEMAH